MASTNAELLAGVVRSIKRATMRHERGVIADFELVEKVNAAISRLDCARPFTPEEKVQYTRNEAQLQLDDASD